MGANKDRSFMTDPLIIGIFGNFVITVGGGGKGNPPEAGEAQIRPDKKSPTRQESGLCGVHWNETPWS